MKRNPNEQIGLKTRLFCQFSGFLWTFDTSFCYKNSIDIPNFSLYLIAPDEKTADKALARIDRCAIAMMRFEFQLKKYTLRADLGR